jgi:hypothetical protein
MDLIIACFTEAHHNPFALFLATGITLGCGGYIFIAVQAFCRSALFRRK